MKKSACQVFSSKSQKVRKHNSFGAARHGHGRLFFVRRVPLRNALVTHVSTQTRAGIGDLRARQSQEESLLHGLAKFRGLNRRAKAGESLVLTDGENCLQRISLELIAISLSQKFPLIPHFLHRYG